MTGKEDASGSNKHCKKMDGAQPQAKCWHTLLGISIFFLLMWIAGAVLLSFGVAFEHEARKFNPRTDFTPMGKCTVISVKHVADQRQDNNPYCVDVYTYSFRAAAGSDTNLTSGADEKQHNKGTHCESSPQIAASFAVHQETACWQPAANESVLKLGSFYKCGNADCIKILDPNDEFETKKARARLFLVLGVAFLVVGLTMWCVLGCMILRMKKKEDVAKVGINEMGPKKSAACSTFDAAVYQKA